MTDLNLVSQGGGVVMTVRVVRCSGRGKGLVGWMSQQQMVRPILALVSYSLLPTTSWGYFVLLP